MADHRIDNGHRPMANMAAALFAWPGEGGLAVPDDDSVAGFGDTTTAAGG